MLSTTEITHVKQKLAICLFLTLKMTASIKKEESVTRYIVRYIFFVSAKKANCHPLIYAKHFFGIF